MTRCSLSIIHDIAKHKQPLPVFALMAYPFLNGTYIASEPTRQADSNANCVNIILNNLW